MERSNKMEKFKEIMKKTGKFLYKFFKVVFAIIGFISIILLIIFLIKPDLVRYLITTILFF